jgi:hypothetical protein
MKRVIVYVENPSSSQLRCIRTAIGERNVADSVLPKVSDVIDSESELEGVLKTLAELRGPPDRLAVIVVPSDPSAAAMSAAEATSALTSEASWEEFLREYQTDAQRVELRMKEHPYCWVVSACVPEGGLPPGMGFLIDKFSRTVFPRRLIDVLASEGGLI